LILDFYFGTGVAGWTAKYVATVYAPFTEKDYFNVSDIFSVPEFGLSMRRAR